MIRIHTAVGMFALLLVAGCGCTDDSTLQPPTNPIQFPAFGPGIRLQPIPVAAPAPVRIDVLFVLDDSWSYQTGFLAGDGRVKTTVAQAIMKNVQEQVAADLAADVRTAPFTYDLAFGVARYEDFGGPFRPSVDPGIVQSRPFVLQMPLYRAERTGFAALFDAALSAPTPGTGDVPAAPFPQPDPSTAIEALYQAATGAGFDGNGNLSTLDSGNPAQEGTVGVPGSGYREPGTSGDVPAVVWVNDGKDDDNEDRFRAQQGNAPASGDLGGAGWRRDALHYIVMASDFATVAPFDAPVPTDVTGIDPAEPAPSAALRSVPPLVTDPRFGSAATVAPTGRATVQQAIDALNAPGLEIEVLPIGTQASANRGGKPNQPLDYLTIAIGPQSVSTFQVGEAIVGGTSGATGTVLVLPANPAVSGFLDYQPTGGFFVQGEVLTGGTSGAKATTLGKPQYGRFPAGPVGALTYPLFRRPSSSDYGDPGPFTWMSIVAHLTGTYDTDFPVASDNMPLVYNLLTVFPTGQAITSDVREDLVDRIALHVQNLPVPGVPTPVDVTVTVTVSSTGALPYVFTIDGSPLPAATTLSDTKVVSVARYRLGVDPVPADTFQRWTLQAQPQTVDQNNDMPGSAQITITRKLTSDPNPAPTVLTANVDLMTRKPQNPVGTSEANLVNVVVAPPPESCFLFQPVPPTVSNVGAAETTYCANFP